MNSNPTQTVYDAATVAGLNPQGETYRFRCRCPVVPEHGRSMTCIEGADGRAVLYCEQRCTPDDLMLAMGLKMRDLAAPRELPTTKAETKTVKVGDRDIQVLSFGSVEPRPLLWLWKPYLPLGKVVILAGAPGNGKSQLTAMLAGLASHGHFYPTDVPEPSRVLLLSAEDDAADTIVPRLMATKADRDRIDYINVATQSSSGLTTNGMIRIPGDIDAIYSYVLGAPDCRLVIMDPVASFFGRDHATTVNQDVRDALDPLASIANQYAVTILLILHLNKSESRDFAQRIAESHGFQAVARQVLALGPDPEDEDGDRGAKKVLAVTKANLAGAGNFAVKCEIVPTDIKDALGNTLETSELQLRGRVNVSADELLIPPGERNARWEARNWLADYVGDGWVQVSAMRKAAISDGIHWRTIERVREAGGYQRKKEAGKPHGSWWIAREGVGGVPGTGGVGGIEDARPPIPPVTGTPPNEDPSDADAFLDDFRRWEERRLGEGDDDQDASG